MTVHVKSAGDPRDVLPALREQVRSLDPELYLERPEPLAWALASLMRPEGKLDDKVAREYETLLHEPQNQEVEAMMMTWADEIEAKGVDSADELGLA